MKHLKYATLLGMLFAIGCLDSLDVVNDNQPDKERVVVTPTDVENLIGGSFRTYWFATEHWEPALGLTVAADELTSSWGNAGMKDISSEPRVAFENTTSYGNADHTEWPWFNIYGAIASVNDGLRAINEGVDLGDDGADNARAIAFGRLVQGISYGFLGSMFDQAFVVDETTDLAALAADPTIAPLKPYGEVIADAVGYLEAAITAAEAAAAFETPESWVANYPMDNALLAQVAHSYIARYTAAVARTPTERAAVSWANVKTHAMAGLAAAADDFGPLGDVFVSWWSNYRLVAAIGGWTRADYHTIGLTDNSGGYDAWLATPTADRLEFTMTTDDRRIHGATPDTVITPADTTDGVITPVDTSITPANKTPGTAFRYAGNSAFRPARGTYHFSRYLHTGWFDWLVVRSSKLTTMSAIEMQLLLAEAEWRMGNTAAAAAIVNVTRTAAGLTALVGDEADFQKWMNYEKKMETFAIATGLAYFDRRGWTNTHGDGAGVSDFIIGTPVHFPVPAKELAIADIVAYTFGGGGEGSALKAKKRTPLSTPLSRRMKE